MNYSLCLRPAWIRLCLAVVCVCLHYYSIAVLSLWWQ